MATEPTEVLITGEVDKLPSEFRALIDPDQPLPDDVQFFEERITSTALAKTMLLSIMLMGAGVLLCILGLLLIFLPVVGIVFLIGGFLLLGSIKPAARAMREQERGNHTRIGLFILPEHVMLRSVMDYSIVPRERLARLRDDRKLVYFQGSAAKQLRLPDQLVEADVETMVAALEAWIGSPGQAAGDAASQ